MVFIKYGQSFYTISAQGEPKAYTVGEDGIPYEQEVTWTEYRYDD